MRNIIKTILSTMTVFALAGGVYAAGNVSVKIEQPKSPSNQTDVKINVVALDTQATNPVTIQCFKKAPGDGRFAQFGSDIVLDAGGNQTNCQTNSSVIPLEGTYQFYATANNGSGPVQSDTVTIEYKLGGPEAPTNYSKEAYSSCSYKIKFHTANDGKTTKIELYRSENTSFNTDSGSRIATQNIGPNTDGEFVTDKPDCNKTYYYAIRAFDSVGNGSGVTGDSETHTINTTVNTGTSGASGAAGALASGTNGNVLGTTKNDTSGATGTQAAILGDASVSGTPTPQPNLPAQAGADQPLAGTTPKTAPTMKKSNVIFGVLAVTFVLFLVWLFKKKNSA